MSFWVDASCSSCQPGRCLHGLFGGRKDASADGSVMCSHNNDGEFDTDPRLVKLQAAEYKKPGDYRSIFYSLESYPRYTELDRGIPEYLHYPKEAENYEAFQTIRYIPQVLKIHAYLEEINGAVTEMQVGIGESTCSGIFWARPIHQQPPNWTALFTASMSSPRLLRSRPRWPVRPFS